ncbi:FAD-binding protein, partial [Prochlorococcus sp. AH-716-I17]|nr:FAD-binding protein [Prochlorococcus sp. AH-716-I17]
MQFTLLKLMLLNDYETKISNVLVVGCGGAGLRAAIEAKTQGLSVNIIGKRSRYDAHTVLAAGGINASLGNVDNNDSWQQHFADTFIEGYGISDPRTVEIMSKEAPDLVSEIDSWGANFARTLDNKIDQRFFGAHTYRRTCYAGDYTGRAILRTLLKKINKLDLSIDDTQYVSHVLVSNNVCFGAISIDMRNAKKILHLCDSLILATGGHTRIWRKSSSRKAENTGDGMALALKVGCPLIDLEMVQFHPTGMLFPKNVEGYLVTEAVRGEGGQLFNSEGERFMSKYDPERLELSSRDRVALANYTEIMEGRSTPNGGVFLDISHKEKDFILEKLPTIYKQFIEHQMLDISKKPMEVAPTAHYSMGGIVVKPDDHSTNIKGLYACGEVSGGLHGANRLGGNSLAEILIFGKRAGIGAARYSKKLKNHIRDNHKVETAILEINNKIKKG